MSEIDIDKIIKTEEEQPTLIHMTDQEIEKFIYRLDVVTSSKLSQALILQAYLALQNAWDQLLQLQQQQNSTEVVGTLH